LQQNGVSSQGSSLAAIYKSFVQRVSGLQKFWEVLDEVDHECWVIDPDNPTRKDTYRRIVIGMILNHLVVIHL
jgi:E3 ubiquitin-protein ligase FANCL